MSTIPAGATHTLKGAYYRQARGGGAYVWCADRDRWVYMEDASARKALRRARPLEERA